MIHDEFERFLPTLMPSDETIASAIYALTELAADELKAHRSVETARSESAVRTQQQLNELIMLRTTRLITDQEFGIQRDILRHKLTMIEASDDGSPERLTHGEASSLRVGQILINGLGDRRCFALFNADSSR